MRTNVLACIPVPPELAVELDRTRVFPNVATVENRTPPHLTLVVGAVGDFSQEAKQSLRRCLRKIRFPKFELQFTWTEGFWTTALVVTTNLPPELLKLRNDAVSVFKSCLGGEIEVFDEMNFRPHVTVARIWKPETPTDSPAILEEIPETVWTVDSFALWTKEGEGEYLQEESYGCDVRPNDKKIGRNSKMFRSAIRILAQISLFFTCFLPLGTFLGDLFEFVLKNWVAVPWLVEAAAFASTLTATAAIWSTIKKKMNVRLAHAVTAFALACSVVLFAAEIRELSVCLATETEEFYCSWIYETLIWSSEIMAGLLLLYFSIPHSKKR